MERCDTMADKRRFTKAAVRAIIIAAIQTSEQKRTFSHKVGWKQVEYADSVINQQYGEWSQLWSILDSLEAGLLGYAKDTKRFTRAEMLEDLRERRDMRTATYGFSREQDNAAQLVGKPKAIHREYGEWLSVTYVLEAIEALNP